MPTQKPELAEMTAEIVSAYVSKNVIPATELPALIGQIHEALAKADAGETEQPEVVLKPAVSIRSSITPDFIVCLEDGKKFKSLKRHLRTHYQLTPEEYREKWGLKPDYPMVAPNYRAVRSELARKIGLGRKKAA